MRSSAITSMPPLPLRPSAWPSGPAERRQPSLRPQIAPGATVDRRYRVVGHIGGGGMAEVYRAVDNLAGRQIALKIADEKCEEFLRNEASLMARLATRPHPNLVGYVGHGVCGETHYLAQELIEGKNLEALLFEGPIRLPQALDIVTQVFYGLNHLHQLGVLHGDVKPENVMMCGVGHYVLVDYGSTVRIGELLKAGTPLYRPPEQDNGQPGDERADVYMVGASLRELLCSHEREMEEYPLALQNIVNRMWAVNREERYRNADEAIAALNVFRAQHLSGEQT